ncbi:non-symbiotic hemoglobin [Klebsormidium nitens]|uniref:Non-symbiotic hemoglobin n=1 Tax=Klebsormidium nitens TaxID=105231 RepID=A0A1Y1HN04_KLENI|nr:non-symbiotic hemoglobin [Klebsormidium nitens]|eukprot:GAQ78371.1 non-symbiotic hemoglobin [Klebsormidium nitens]
MLSLVRGQSDDHAKAEALSKALAEEVLPLTLGEQELVRETWTMLESNLADNGIALYLRLFEIAPEAKGLFAFSEDEENPLHKDPTMRLHATEVLRSLGLAACRIGQSMRIGGVLENLGRRHVDYGATLEVYSVTKEAFLWVVERALEENSCPEVLTAWSKAYDNLANAMKRGHQAVVEERRRAAPRNGSPARPPRSSPRKLRPFSKLGLNKLRSFGDRITSEKGRTWHGATQYAAATMGTSNV